ncbi:hypothetical protein OC844_006692 [Tilletia horrida]|nr:hypothetical protein OC844_006692 [Tilletia horrida]
MISFKDGLEQLGAPMPDFERDFVLLPLIRPYPEAPNATSPAADEFAFLDAHRPPRIAFRAQDGTDWIATTHVLPGAYPRMHDAATSPPSAQLFPIGHGADGKPGAVSPKEIREKQWEALASLTEANPPPTYYPPTSELDAELDAEKRKAARDPQLWTVVERIVPMRSAAEQVAIDRQARPGLTLVLCHANGFHKETYEPFAHSLVDALAADSGNSVTGSEGTRIDEIWSIDVIDSGDAGLLNARFLGRTLHWMDHTRDIHNFLRFYLPKTTASIAEEGTGSTHLSPAQKGKGIAAGAPSMPNPELRPTWPPRQLPRLNDGEGLQGRRIVLLGHSFSGAAIANLNVLQPTLTEHSILVDPVILSSNKWEDGIVGCWPHNHMLGRGAAIRQEVWPSAQNALASFQKKAFFAAWDPRTLDLFVRFGLRPLHPNPTPGGAGGPQTLAMSKWREAEAFNSNWVARYTWALLERSRGKTRESEGEGEKRERGPIHIFTMSASPGGIYCEEPDADEQIRALVRAQGPRCSSKVLPGGHLVVQEQPALLAAEVSNILLGKTAKPVTQKAKL